MVTVAALPCRGSAGPVDGAGSLVSLFNEEDRVAGGSITSGITESIVRRFEGLAATRDRALGEGRQITRLAANSVRATHRGQLDEARSEEHTSELQSQSNLVCRLLLEKKNRVLP